MKRIVNKKQCDKCNQFFHPGILSRHKKYCNGEIKKKKELKIKLDNNWLLENKNYKCPYCQKEYVKNGICSHIYSKHLNINYESPFIKYNQDIKDGLIQHPNKNKSLTNEQKEKIRISSIGKKHTEKSKMKMKESSKDKGGIRKGGGRTKKGWYMGIWCDSSWELAFLIYHLDKCNKIIKNETHFEYEFNNKKYKYYPDFILNGEYCEIKGYEDDKSKEKKKQFPYKLNTYYTQEMKPILEYVILKYGKDFIKMYEYSNNKNYSKQYDLCKCGNKKHKKSKQCNDCYRIYRRIVNRPSYEQLIKEINELGYVGTGKKYNVSDNAIRKWKKNYENKNFL